MSSWIFLKKSRDYSAVYRNSRFSFKSENFVFVYSSVQYGPTRFGITVSKKVGGAVIRNYIKRCVREILRKEGDILRKNYDVIIVSRSRSARNSYADFYREILKFFTYLNKC